MSKGENVESFSIADIKDGKIIKKLEDAIKMIAADIANRPDIFKARKLAWALEFTPTKEGFVTVLAKEPTLKFPDSPAETALCGMPDEDGNFKVIKVQTTQRSIPGAESGFRQER